MSSQLTFFFFYVLQISPFILNTVVNITAAMTTQRRDEQGREVAAKPEDLWSVRDIYSCNFWFLGVDQAMEVTESFREEDGRNQGENFAAEVKVGGHSLCASGAPARGHTPRPPAFFEPESHFIGAESREGQPVCGTLLKLHILSVRYYY